MSVSKAFFLNVHFNNNNNNSFYTWPGLGCIIASMFVKSVKRMDGISLKDGSILGQEFNKNDVKHNLKQE